MDTETREVLESIRTDITGLRTELHTDITGLRSELRTDIAGLRTEVHTEIAGLRTEMHTEIAGLRTEMHTEIAGLRVDMREGDETTRRHFDVVAESLRGDIRAVAEGIAASTESALRLHHELRAEMDTRFRSLEMVLRVAFAGLRREINDLRSGE